MNSDSKKQYVVAVVGATGAEGNVYNLCEQVMVL